MKVVIDIDENILNDAKNGHIRLGEIADAVLSGTPLPKGHGDLISRSALKEKLQGQTSNGTYAAFYVNSIIDDAPAVIGADETQTANPIVFTVSKFSGVKFDCLITTPDARAIEDSRTQCFSSSVLGVMGVLSEKYNNKGFAVLFEVD